MLSKKELRKAIIENKSDLSAQQISAASQKILNQLTSCLRNEDFKAVHIYQSLLNLKEPDTEPIIAWLMDTYSQIKIFIPTVDQANKASNVDDQNIIEHNKQIYPSKRIMSTSDKIDIFLLPLVAFDESGNRLGHGGGFYDKLLSHYPKAKKIGLAFEVQKIDSIPIKPHDVQLDVVVTESQIYQC